jgi:hypothetical protein
MGQPVMGRHEHAGAIAAHDQDQALREQAADLAASMTRWLSASVLTATPLYPASGDTVCAELEEWCRQARDILEAVAHG